MLQEVDYYDILPGAERCGKENAIGQRTMLCLKQLDALEEKKKEEILKLPRSKQQCPPTAALVLARRLATEQVGPVLKPMICRLASAYCCYQSFAVTLDIAKMLCSRNFTPCSRRAFLRRRSPMWLVVPAQASTMATHSHQDSSRLI